MEKPEKKRGEVEEEKEGVDGDAKEMWVFSLPSYCSFFCLPSLPSPLWKRCSPLKNKCSIFIYFSFFFCLIFCGDFWDRLMAVLRRMALCPCKTFLCLIFSGFGFYIALDGKKVSPLSDFEVVDFCCCATYRCSYVRFWSCDLYVCDDHTACLSCLLCGFDLCVCFYG